MDVKDILGVVLIIVYVSGVLVAVITVGNTGVGEVIGEGDLGKIVVDD